MGSLYFENNHHVVDTTILLIRQSFISHWKIIHFTVNVNIFVSCSTAVFCVCLTTIYLVLLFRGQSCHLDCSSKSLFTLQFTTHKLVVLICMACLFDSYLILGKPSVLSSKQLLLPKGFLTDLPLLQFPSFSLNNWQWYFANFSHSKPVPPMYICMYIVVCLFGRCRKVKMHTSEKSGKL